MSNAGNEKEYIKKHEKYMIQVPGFFPLVITEAHGSTIRDIKGKEYIDFGSMIAGPAGIGNSNPKVISAIKNQTDKLICSSPWFMNIPKVQLAEKLAKITPGNLNKFHFLCGGGEANEYALHIAMKVTKKKGVIGLYYGYHGSSFACLALGQPWNRKGITIMPGFKQIPPAYCYRCFYGQNYPDCNFECANALENAIKLGSYDDTGVFLAEPMQGNGGHIIPPKEYFKIIRDICNKNGVLLIFDEIQTGFGRVGKMFGADYYRIVPDIMTMGKVMGGGIPISAAAFRDDIIMPTADEQEIVSSFATAPVGCAASIAVLDFIKENDIPKKAAEAGAYVLARLKEMQDKYSLIGDVRSVGMFSALELVKNRRTKEKATVEAEKVIKKCRENGLIILLSNKAKIGNIVKLLPPMNIERDILSKGLDILDNVIAEVSSSIQ